MACSLPNPSANPISFTQPAPTLLNADSAGSSVNYYDKQVSEINGSHILGNNAPVQTVQVDTDAVARFDGFFYATSPIQEIDFNTLVNGTISNPGYSAEFGSGSGGITADVNSSTLTTSNSNRKFLTDALWDMVSSGDGSHFPRVIIYPTDSMTSLSIVGLTQFWSFNLFDAIRAGNSFNTAQNSCNSIF